MGRFGLFSGGEGKSGPEPQRLVTVMTSNALKDQNQAASKMLSSSAWIGYVATWPAEKSPKKKNARNRSPWPAKVADRSWLDGVQCGYFQDFVEVSTSNCTRCKLRSNEILGDFVSCKFSNHLKHIS